MFEPEGKENLLCCCDEPQLVLVGRSDVFDFMATGVPFLRRTLHPLVTSLLSPFSAPDDGPTDLPS